ncbi:sensor histidine kinase [Deinococcus radiotolerans]|nr:ATP-binding protein [Deinococcus radiotolerans]
MLVTLGTASEIASTVVAAALQVTGVRAGEILMAGSGGPVETAGVQEDDPPGFSDLSSLSEAYPLTPEQVDLRNAQSTDERREVQLTFPLPARPDGDDLRPSVLPMTLSGQSFGVLILHLSAEQSMTPEEGRFLRTLADVGALALGRFSAAGETHELEVPSALNVEQTRQLEEERAAHAAFVAFTEAVGSETDLATLVGRAITLLHETCDVEAAYFERSGELFSATAWSPSADPGLLPHLQRGFPLEHSGIARGLQQGTATYIDHWRDTGLLIEASGIYQAVAGYPYFVDGTLDTVLMIGSQTEVVWDERRKGIFRAVGRSLDLALDRARQTRLVTAQRDALDIRTQELAESAAELQAFSYSVSHDLRTPVRHITGFLELARKTLGDRLDARSARYLGMVEQSGRQMNTLIDGLLDLSRAAQQTLTPGVVDLNSVVARIQMTLLPDLLSRDVEWTVADLPAVWGDERALSQVLTQLTENALKFTQHREPARIEIWAEVQGGGWKVCVRDNGLGFDPRYQDRLFQLFQRLHRADEVPGTGVGLASVRRLVLKHGGQVFAEGQPGEGATFGFTLPRGRVS